MLHFMLALLNFIAGAKVTTDSVTFDMPHRPYVQRTGLNDAHPGMSSSPGSAVTVKLGRGSQEYHLQHPGGNREALE